jgi:23S rRNA pseudouridine2605 synthase
VRLAKYLANQGAASRRKSEVLISQGRVTVNGSTVSEQGFKIDPQKDRVEVDGKLLMPEAKVYILLNKPSGYLSSVSDPWGRPVVVDLIKDSNRRIYPVGRLDFDTEGLLLLSNDGEFANLIIHPRHQIDKKYEALVTGRVSKDTISKLKKGIVLEDGITAPAQARILGYEPEKTLVEIIIHEGKKRQIKRMLACVGHPVEKLKRTGIAFLTLEGLSVGQYRYLTSEEVVKLKAAALNY